MHKYVLGGVSTDSVMRWPTLTLTAASSIVNTWLPTAATDINSHPQLKSSTASASQPLVRFEVHYTAATVDVGNLDILKQTYADLLAASDDHGVELHKMDRVLYKQCALRGSPHHL